MKFTDFDFSFSRTDNNATLHFKADYSNDLYLYMYNISSKCIDQAPISWDDIMWRMRCALDKEPDGVDAQVSVVYRFDGTMKIVLSLRDFISACSIEFWAQDVENCLN